jgi:hypothetical protein
MPDGSQSSANAKIYVCNMCGSNSESVEFYPSVTSRCKECHKAAVQEKRSENIDHYKEFDRARAWNPDRVAARKAYAGEMKKDPEFKEKQNIRKMVWQDKNKVKRRAHVMVGNAVRGKNLLRPDHCERCEKLVHTDAHHENYYKPLDVVWLCEDCHGIRHREINAEIRQGVDWSIKGF